MRRIQFAAWNISCCFKIALTEQKQKDALDGWIGWEDWNVCP
jgi:hypothetical protein